MRVSLECDTYKLIYISSLSLYTTKSQNCNVKVESLSSRPRFARSSPEISSCRNVGTPNVQPTRLRNRNFENNAARRISRSLSPSLQRFRDNFVYPNDKPSLPLARRGGLARETKERRRVAVLVVVVVVVATVVVRGEERRRRY